MGPPKHSRARNARFKRSRLPFRHGFVKSIEGRIGRSTANVVRTRKNSECREANRGELPAARANRLRCFRRTRRLMAFGIGQRKWLANDSRRARRRSREGREVFLELTGYVVGVSIRCVQVDRRRDLISVL